MLHEILLSLSGQSSPLLGSRLGEDVVVQDDFALLSPPEKALLGSIAHLSRLHADLRSHTSLTSTSHPSVVCRSVSTAIEATHLGDFQKTILEVEKAILAEDSKYVGGYGIVPLSTIVGDFAPWTRRLEWLWEIIRFIGSQSPLERRNLCTGAALIDHLRGELQTGYPDIKEMAVQLVNAAETAWMKQLSMWLLYGNLPIYGKEDFFIQEDLDSEEDDTQFKMHMDLLPKFVSEQTAGSILFIGKSLNHIRAKRKTSSGISTAPVRLYQDHIDQLSGLKPPISPSKVTTAVDCIRLSLSQSTLSKLLPLPKILEMLTLLHDFLLLGRGEFAVALVSHADSRIEENRRRGALEGYLIKEGDVMTSLVQAWAELVSLQKEEDPVDEELELARELLRLSISDRKTGRAATPSHISNTVPEVSNVSFDDLLFPTPTCLTAQVRAPLDLFISSSDIACYSKIHSYLLGIRRAQIRLGDLWKRTSLRRSHGSSRKLPRSNNAFWQNKLKANRERENTRTQLMRPIWATASACLFVLSEIGSFFQGEVVHESWQHLCEWIEGGTLSSTSAPNSRPGTASSFKAQRIPGPATPSHTSSRPSSRPSPVSMGRHDPEALTVAHRRHLSTIIHSLFLTDVPFTNALRALLTSVDRFVALAIRLETIQRNMDLEEDEGVVDALVDYAQEEREVWQGLRETRDDVKTEIQELIGSLREMDDRRSGSGYSTNHGTTGAAGGRAGSTGPSFSHYAPRQPAGVDRLLMKLDFGSLRSVEGAAITPGLADLE
ncbi:Spc97/Spc98 [Penicillium argentinense]|uniref:Spindle pole body component n=1 Tax=Penicillium argentinense TaxID=1131581 RepID=A0A9W9FDQ8_9EURO|nr:Spc97/Spc98 [Penicillium argentinense]KAJ5098200.1 Spc97/Spc98 [Penicillium argentinense]